MHITAYTFGVDVNGELLQRGDALLHGQTVPLASDGKI
jgi:hypothetical protein